MNDPLVIAYPDSFGKAQFSVCPTIKKASMNQGILPTAGTVSVSQPLMSKIMPSDPLSWSDWVDLRQIESLAKGDMSFVRSMIDIYLEDMPKYATELQVAFEQKEWSQVNYLAHRTKSLVAIVRVREMHEILTFLEYASSSELARSGEKIHRLKKVHTRIIADLSRERVRLASSSDE